MFKGKWLFYAYSKQNSSARQGVGAQTRHGGCDMVGAAGVMCTPVQRNKLSEAARYNAEINIQKKTLLQQRKRTFDFMMIISSILQFVALLYSTLL